MRKGQSGSLQPDFILSLFCCKASRARVSAVREVELDCCLRRWIGFEKVEEGEVRPRKNLDFVGPDMCALSRLKINSANYNYKLGTCKGPKHMLPGMFASRRAFCVVCTKEQG